MTNVLVVDDSDVDRLLVSGLLSQVAEYNVIAAENGVQALQKMEEWPIDIILTDLQMPKMNGLQLVEKIRKSKLEIPIILITGVGSEAIAAKALLAGAAGYIPKSSLNKMLIPTVTDVLEIFYGKQHHGSLLARTKLFRYEIELENDPTMLPLLVDFCERILNSSTHLDRIDCLRIAIAIEHALQNALYRGNLEIGSEQNVRLFGFQNGMDEMPMFLKTRFEEEPYKSRNINLVFEIKPSGFAIRIRDEGPGFDTSTVGDLNTLSTHGTNLMNAFMDEVQYNETGNEVRMIFRFDRSKRVGHRIERKERRGDFGRLICQETGVAHKISVRKFVIGRGDACHMKLQGDSISKLHFMLVVDEDEVILTNLSSEFTTLVNGHSCKRSSIRQDDLISVGGKTFKFEAAKKKFRPTQ